MRLFLIWFSVKASKRQCASIFKNPLQEKYSSRAASTMVGIETNCLSGAALSRAVLDAPVAPLKRLFATAPALTVAPLESLFP